MSIVIADGIDEVRKAVREQIRRGADWIKVMASGGAASPADKINGTQYSVDELRVAVQEAAASGVRVMAHALPPSAIRNCVDAGVRSIEHGNFLDAETAVLMAQHDVFLVPTIATYELAARFPDVYGYNEEQRVKIDRAAAMSMDALQHARNAGVRIANGSDMLADDLKEMAQELTFKAEVLGAAGAIESATKTSAELLGLDGEIGSIEPGRRADILVVDGDPLRDIRILEKRESLRVIMKAGSLHKHTLN